MRCISSLCTHVKAVDRSNQINLLKYFMKEICKEAWQRIASVPVKNPVMLTPWTSYVLLWLANSLCFAMSVVSSRVTSWKHMRIPSLEDKISVSMKSAPSSIAFCKRDSFSGKYNYKPKMKTMPIMLSALYQILACA